VLYAKIVLPLPVEGPFDYQVLPEDESSVRPGSRAWINFRGKKEVGYIVSLSPEPGVAKVKPIIKLLDNVPVLGQNMLDLTRAIADYYSCTWGEAIAASLPEPLRKGKPLSGLKGSGDKRAKDDALKGVLLLDQDGALRWDFYCRQISETVSSGRSVIVLVSDKTFVPKAGQVIRRKTGLEVLEYLRQEPGELTNWEKIKNGLSGVVVGTRSSVFAPAADLGLIIIDEEADTVYKQDQSPHYHARQVALMRSELEGARIILGGIGLSLESFYLAKKEKLEFNILARRSAYPEVRIIDMKNLPLLDKRKNIILSRLLQDAMVEALAARGKILLFLDRKGFATSAICSGCGRALKCPRCNTNLVYYFDQALLRCRYCSYKLVPPKICPQCNSGYIKFSGAGTEKIESELSRIFPQAGVKRLDPGQVPGREEADIFIATQGIIRQSELRFDLTAVLAADNSLNHVDFRSSEKTFSVLQALAALTDKTLFIQTSLPGHYVFSAIKQNDPGMFYEEELKSRRQVKFPPFRNFCQLRLRGRSETAVAEAAEKLFAKLNGPDTPKGVEVISLNPGQPPKLRGNFYQVILLASANVLAMNKFLKNSLKDFRQSGIIVTVDVDPV